MRNNFIQTIIILLLSLTSANNARAIRTEISSKVNESDSLALVALYNATQGAGWTFSTNWLTGPVRSWHGITVTNDRVTDINLFSNRLIGQIPPQIENLTALISFTAHSNQLTGPLPPEVGQLTSLKTLHLASNSLNGTLPPQLGLLQNLEYMYLHANRFEGHIPPELGQLNKLIYLFLYSNSLTGTIPPELGSMQALQRLYLYSNKLSGSIPPELGNMAQMRLLHLQTNELTGTIPPELGNLKLASYLYLQQNRLSGQIPSELGDMTSMQYLRLENNALSGQIPSALSKLKNLRQLFLDMNQLSGSIPPELGDLSLLQTLSISLNQLTGSIPLELGKLNNLSILNLSVNQISGSIPTELGNLSKLTQLLLDRNSLNGDIPAELNKLQAIEKLSLASNRLSGFLPDSLHKLPNLQNIEVYYNNLTFEDFENKQELFNRNFFYSPQNKIGQSFVVSVDTSANYTLEMACGGSQNSYQWFFNYEVLSGLQNQSNYKLQNIGPEQLGLYHCKITNPLVPGLAIESEPIVLQFKPIGENRPTNIFLSSHSVTENLPVGTEVGKLSAEDDDYDDKHVFSLVQGEGDTNNASFFIAGNQLHTKAMFVYDEKNSYNIRIEVRDKADQAFQKAFTIYVERGTELVISDILLSNNTFDEKIPIGTLIGYLSTVDTHSSPVSAYTFQLVDGEGDTDNSRFFIAANQLHSNTLFNYNAKNSFEIRVETKNKYGKTYEKTFVLTASQTGNEHPLLIPDAFSPNGDGINDLFEIKGIEFYPEALVEIYNRSGKLVYRHSNENADLDDPSAFFWNGSITVNGATSSHILPEGYYFLRCKTAPQNEIKKTIFLKH